MLRIRSLIRSFSLSLATGTLIAIASLIPGGSLPRISWGDMLSLDKWVHFCIYGALAFFLQMEFERYRPAGYPPGRSLKLLFSCAGYGIILEGLQVSMNQGRYFEVLDIIANIIGALAGLWLCRLLIKK